MRAFYLFCLCGALAMGQDIKGVVDLHVHSDPDSMPRSIDGLDVSKLAASRGVRALVLKNHYEPTASLAYLARKFAPGIEVFGGIALNLSVGGVNPFAVERMTRVKGGWGRVVWMPTFDSENNVHALRESRPFVSISKGNVLLPPVMEVLGIIAKNQLLLATGHSSPAEVLLLIRAGRQQGIDQILVTHPTVAPVLMSIAEMREAAKLGAKLEFTYDSLMGTRKAENRRALREVGPEHCVLTTDLGQAGNPLPPDGFDALLKSLAQDGFTARELNLMSKENPAALLRLPLRK